jgi:hypothetical protein
MKEITHRVNKHHTGRWPGKWLHQLIGYESQVKSGLVWMILYATKSFGEGLGIAVFAARTNLCTTTDRVPCSVGPLDFAIGRHDSDYIWVSLFYRLKIIILRSAAP